MEAIDEAENGLVFTSEATINLNKERK